MTDNILSRLERLEQMLYHQQVSPNGAQTEASLENASHYGSTPELIRISPDPPLAKLTPVSFSSRTAFSVDPGSDEPPLDSLSQSETPKKHCHVSHAHNVYIWPAIVEVLKRCSASVLDALFSLYFSEISWLMRLQKPAWHEKSFSDGIPQKDNIGSEAYLVVKPSEEWFSLPYGEIQKLSTVYFNTFNYLYSFMDRERFFTITLPSALNGSRQAEESTIIILLVLALGQLAQEGSVGTPVSRMGERSSGVRGGTAELPPGSSLFDKARRRIGFAATQYELENVQIFSLAG
jgi:hypothetical protein